MLHSCTTCTEPENGRHPALLVHWEETAHGYNGRGVVWLDHDRRLPEEYAVTLTQSLPLGSISARLDPCSGGCWRSTTLDGTGITERDLQWAAAWAAEGIRQKRVALGMVGWEDGPCPKGQS